MVAAAPRGKTILYAWLLVVSAAVGIVVGITVSWVPAIVVTAGLILLLCCVTIFPELIAPGRELEESERLKLQNEVRGTPLAAITAILTIAGFLFTWQQIQDNQRQLSLTRGQVAEQIDLTRQGQYAESFGRAAQQLGGDNTELKIGGIATLADRCDV